MYGTMIFVPFKCGLRFLEIHIDIANVEDFALLASLMVILSNSLPSPATLEHLEFNIWVRDLGNGFDNTFYENLRETWSHLDYITTHPTGSRLQRVDINIKAAFSSEHYTRVERKELDENKVLKAAFDALPLLHTKGIAFVKTAMTEGFEYVEDSGRERE